MDSQRFRQRQADFLNAAKRLVEVASMQGDDVVRDATIQRFEFTFEAGWKALQMYIQYQGLEANGPRQVIKQSFVQGIIRTPEEADIWLDMLEDRNLTTHTYREDLAEIIARHVRERYAVILHDMARRLSDLAMEE